MFPLKLPYQPQAAERIKTEILRDCLDLVFLRIRLSALFPFNFKLTCAKGNYTGYEMWYSL